MTQKGGIKVRANWKKLVSVWDAENPRDKMTRAVLKSEYYRILRDKNVQNSWIALRIAPKLATFAKELQELGPRMDKVIKRSSDKIIEFWRQHPEAKNLGELVEIEEALRERTRRNDSQD